MGCLEILDVNPPFFAVFFVASTGAVIHFSVLEMKKNGQNSGLAVFDLCDFLPKGRRADENELSTTGRGPAVCVSFPEAFYKDVPFFHKVFFLNLFPEVVLRKSIFLSREFSRYS